LGVQSINIIRRRPVFFASVLTIALVAAFAWFVSRRDAGGGGAEQRPSAATAGVGEARTLSSLSVALTVREHAQAAPDYAITIAIEGDKTFTMPIRFIRGTQQAQVTPADATRLMDAWIKARATGIAQFGVMTPDRGPYLLIDVDTPGAR
jgi:hypothetical protein